VAHKLSSRYRLAADAYRRFAEADGFPGDFSDSALQELYVHESTGRGTVSERNGFAYGKRSADITISAWREDIAAGLLAAEELHADPRICNKWLDKVLR
jgi:hypothetical protein